MLESGRLDFSSSSFKLPSEQWISFSVSSEALQSMYLESSFLFAAFSGELSSFSKTSLMSVMLRWNQRVEFSLVSQARIP